MNIDELFSPGGEEKCLVLIEKQRDRLGLWVKCNQIEDAENDKDLVATYRLQTVKVAGGAVDLLLFLSQKDETRYHICYPVRTIFEISVKLSWLATRGIKEQEDNARGEVLKVAKRFYDVESTDEAKIGFKNFFDKYKRGKEDILTHSVRDVLPPMWEMLKDLELSEQYFLYRVVCELVHGQYFSHMLYDHEKYRFAQLAHWHLERILSVLNV